jgi:SAM-dependent methyltransferase
MSAALLPVPPVDLLVRVGMVEGADPVGFYLDEGARLRRLIDQLLPGDWDWTGKRVLDFGCGSARVLRHFESEAQRGTFAGSDIDEASIAWDNAHLNPPFRFFSNAVAPPLAAEAASLDLVWAMSVFTHITDLWSDWLTELHHRLAPGGILIASFLGEGMWEALVQEPYPEDEVGMAVLHHWEGPDAWVFHSEWWLREHWGRAFDVLTIQRPPRSAAGTPEITHSYIVLRKRGVVTTPGDLERLAKDDPREIASLQTSVRLARTELAGLAAQIRPSRRAALRGRLSMIRRHLPR